GSPDVNPLVYGQMASSEEVASAGGKAAEPGPAGSPSGSLATVVAFPPPRVSALSNFGVILPAERGASLSEAPGVGEDRGPNSGPDHGLSRAISTTSWATGTASHPDASGTIATPLAGRCREEVLRPSTADLIADLLPFDRSSLERAVDQLLGQLGD